MFRRRVFNVDMYKAGTTHESAKNDENMKISDLTLESIFGAGVASESIVGRERFRIDS